MAEKNPNRENIAFNMYSVAISWRNSPASFPEHWHLSAEFILAMEDDCNYTVGKDAYRLDSGDVLLIWPTELHSVVRTPERASLLMQFDPSVIAGCRDLDLTLPLIQSTHLVSAKEKPELNRRIADLMKDSLRLYQSGDYFINTKIIIHIYEILMALCASEMKRSGSLGMDGSGVQTMLRKVQNACSYISRNCERDLTQKEVADYIGFSYYYFSRVFKDYTGTGFSDYLARQRIGRAVQMLGTDGNNITEIAYRAGFQSISSFNRAFRAYMNCSPREYRNNYRAPQDPYSRQVLAENFENRT